LILEACTDKDALIAPKAHNDFCWHIQRGTATFAKQWAM
jgi:hypothetical protein